MAASAPKPDMKVGVENNDTDDLADIQSPKMTLKGVDMDARLDEGGEVKKVMQSEYINDEFLSNGGVKSVKDADRRNADMLGGGIKGIKPSK
jgi:hypothetical protein